MDQRRRVDDDIAALRMVVQSCDQVALVQFDLVRALIPPSRVPATA